MTEKEILASVLAQFFYCADGKVYYLYDHDTPLNESLALEMKNYIRNEKLPIRLYEDEYIKRHTTCAIIP